MLANPSDACKPGAGIFRKFVNSPPRRSEFFVGSPFEELARIMFIGITTFGADCEALGIKRYAIALMESLARIDQEDDFEVLAFQEDSDLFAPRNVNCSTMIFPHRRGRIRDILWHRWKLGKLCRRRGYDVLFLPAGSRRLVGFSPCPTVGTVHELPDFHVPGNPDRFGAHHFRRVFRDRIRRLNRIITVSEFSKSDIVNQTGVQADRVRVIPLGVDAERFHPRDPQPALRLLEARYGIREPFWLYLSRIEHPGKNHIRLIQAFEKLKAERKWPHQLVLAGPDWAQHSKVHQAAAQSAFRKDIVFTGFLGPDEIPLLFSAAQAFVFPSLLEGFAWPVLDAFCSGVPVACSNRSPVRDLAGSAAVLFDPTSVDSIATSLATLVECPRYRQALRDEGIKRSGEFSWTKVAQRTWEVLREAAAEAA